MCAGPDAMDRSTANDYSFSVLLELAASNSLDDFKAAVDSDVTAVDIAGLWFCRNIGSAQMSLHHRTPLMIAAAYGSLDVLRFILDVSTSPVDRGCGPDGFTALHCAASGGSPNAAGAVKILLSAGADPDSADSAGRRAADVVAGSPGSKIRLHELLGGSDRVPIRALRISTSPSTTGSPPLSSSPGDGGSPSSDSTAPERKEYPVDPSLPDIKNSVYASDEFRIYSFKIRPCSRAYSHDWTECPFVHPGENARRRDPRKYNYSCVPCPDFRKGSCNRGDACEYAHGVFESWLHPAQYRTKLCKDGTSCNRRVCFFAHTNDELRTLYIPGGGVDSPRSVRALEMAMLSLLPGSPSAAAAGAGFSSAANGLSSPSMGWPQPSVPMLHLPFSNFQSSRLRSSLSARDMPPGDFSSMLEVDDICFSPNHTRPSLFTGINTKSLPSANLDNLFSAEVLSPRYNNSTETMFSPSHKAALLNQLHQHQQSILSPINTRMYSPRSMEPQQHAAMLQSSLGMASPGRMSPRSIEQLAITAQREKLQQQQQHLLRCLSDRNLGPTSPSSTKWGSSAGKLDWGVNGEELDRLKNAPFELDSGGVDVSWVQSMLSSPDKECEVAVNACNGDPAIGNHRANLNPSGDPSIGNNRANFNPLPLMEGHAVLDSWLEQMQLDHA